MTENVGEEFELYLSKWRGIFVILNIVFFFLSYFVVCIFTIIFLNLNGIFRNNMVLISIVISAVISSLPLFRNKIILFVFRNISNERYIMLNDFLLAVHYVYSIIILSYFISYKYIDVNNSVEYAIVILKIFIIWLAYVPIWSLFAGSITILGLIRIWMEMDKLHRKSFSKRQKWMSKILGVLEKKLKKGNIYVSKDKLIYNINNKILSGEDISRDLEDIYSWIINENNKIVVLNNIKKIMPKGEVIYYKSIPIFIIIINTVVANKKYIFIMLLILLSIKEPELAKSIIAYLKSLFSIPF